MHCSLARHGETGSVVVVIGIFSFLKIKVFIRIAPPPRSIDSKRDSCPKIKRVLLDWSISSPYPFSRNTIGKQVPMVLVR